MLEGPSVYLMKSPPVESVEEEAHERTEQFVREDARTTVSQSAPAEAQA